MLAWNVKVPRPGRLKHSIPANTFLLEVGDLGLRDGLRDLHPGLCLDVVVVSQAAASGNK